MAVLKYLIAGQKLHMSLPSHANQPGQTIMRIGTKADSDQGEQVLCLPPESGIAPLQAWIYETKSPPLFVLVSQEPHVWVNHSPVSTIKVLDHNDRISLGTGRKIELVFQDEFIRILESDFECQVCYQVYHRSDLVFRCPICIDRMYCFKCVVHNGLKCHCGYDFRTVIRSILINTEIKKYFPRAANRLVVEMLNDISPLVGKNCSSKLTAGSGSCRMRTFKIGDEVIYCPECTASYHLDCWLRLNECTVNTCQHTRIQEALHQIFLDELTG